MRKVIISFLAIALVQFFVYCENREEQTFVVVETSYGELVIKLYNETPAHRDNFIQLVEDGFYDGLLFHRVINEFMIQAGDPDSRDADQDTRLGGGGPGYTLDAEINYPQFFHKKGALAAARQGDQVNPEKESSGSQFYIVHGKVYTDEELDQVERMIDDNSRQKVLLKYMEPFREELVQMQQTGDREGYMNLMQEISFAASGDFENIDDFKFPAEHRHVYSTIGGAPHLDGEYTVFGEVVEGLDVIDSIAGLEVNSMNRPVEDEVLNIYIKD